MINTTPDELRALLKQAKLNLMDASRIFNISRSTVDNWLIGGMAPKNAAVQQHINRQIELIKTGVETGMFPSRHTEREYRISTINNILLHLDDRKARGVR